MREEWETRGRRDAGRGGRGEGGKGRGRDEATREQRRGDAGTGRRAVRRRGNTQRLGEEGTGDHPSGRMRQGNRGTARLGSVGRPFARSPLLSSLLPALTLLTAYLKLIPVSPMSTTSVNRNRSYRELDIEFVKVLR